MQRFEWMIVLVIVAIIWLVVKSRSSVNESFKAWDKAKDFMTGVTDKIFGEDQCKSCAKDKARWYTPECRQCGMSPIPLHKKIWWEDMQWDRTPFPIPPGTVSLYEHASYNGTRKGKRRDFPPGKFNMFAADNDFYSSARVPNGMKLNLYGDGNQKNLLLTLTSDMPNFPGNVNDKVSSIEVIRAVAPVRSTCMPIDTTKFNYMVRKKQATGKYTCLPGWQDTGCNWGPDGKVNGAKQCRRLK